MFPDAAGSGGEQGDSFCLEAGFCLPLLCRQSQRPSSRLLERLFQVSQSGCPAGRRRWSLTGCVCSQAYVWDNNKDLVEWLEKQLTEEDGVRSVIEENIKYISRDYVLKQIRR